MEQSFFARLSPEIRNVIWEYAFTSPYAVTLQSGLVQHALTKTCRRIRNETLAMFYALTDFNAHLDDGPATPLAEWLQILGPELVLQVNSINIWDMHMLNGTLHGQEATQRLLREGPRLHEFGDKTPTTSSSAPNDRQDADSKTTRETYLLRPIGNWIFNRGWYLKDIILALHSMGLGLSRFCIQSNPSSSTFALPSNPDNTLKFESKFAIVPLASKPTGEIFTDPYTEINVLARQFGLPERAREELILRLAGGDRRIVLQERHRKLVFEFEEGRGTRLKTMKQEFTMSELEGVDWSALSNIESFD